MRLLSGFALLLSLACAGGVSDAPADKVPVRADVPPPPVEKRASTSGDPFAALSAATDPSLADQWLVILASKKDPGEAVPSLDVVKAHPELGTRPTTLLSSRFKNLMPCYAVTVAGAWADKAAALDVSKQLTALNVDNYVKNAGAHVEASPAIDRWCATGAEDEKLGDARLLVKGGSLLWLPVEAPEAVITNARATAPPPESMSPQYDGWRQPFKTERVGSVAREQRWHVLDVGGGTTWECTVDAFAVLTLGTPHFGVLQEGTPKRPSCGEPEIYAALACPKDLGEGPWIATADATPLGAWAPAGEEPALVEAAKKAVSEATRWEEAQEGNAEVERTITVTRWVGPNDAQAHIVEAKRSFGDGLCGGEEISWVGLFAGKEIGQPIGGWREVSVETGAWAVDVGADGTPELLTAGFPSVSTLVSGTGELATQDIAFCDCPC